MQTVTSSECTCASFECEPCFEKRVAKEAERRERLRLRRKATRAAEQSA